jgi:hypothetical protein
MMIAFEIVGRLRFDGLRGLLRLPALAGARWRAVHQAPRRGASLSSFVLPLAGFHR